MTNKEKRILPYMILIFVLALAGIIYWLFFSKASPIYTPSPQTISPTQLSAPTKQLGAYSEEVAPPASVGNAMLGGGNNLDDIQDYHLYTYTDSEGNIVQEILEPEPMTVDSNNHLLISDDNKKIMNLLRDNLLLEVQAKNDELKADKKARKMTQPSVAKGVMPTEMNGEYVSIPNVNTSNFTELERTQPLLSSMTVEDADIDDEFARISLASISVIEMKDKAAEVSAWVRFDNKLFKAIKGRKIGDFEFGNITSSDITIRYIPANVTKKLGHSGFES